MDKTLNSTLLKQQAIKKYEDFYFNFRKLLITILPKVCFPPAQDKFKGGGQDIRRKIIV